MATLPVGPSASRTTPYVPAPSVRPNRYLDLFYNIEPLMLRSVSVLSEAGIVLFLIALGLAVEAVQHASDYIRGANSLANHIYSSSSVQSIIGPTQVPVVYTALPLSPGPGITTFSVVSLRGDLSGFSLLPPARHRPSPESNGSAQCGAQVLPGAAHERECR